MNSTANPSSRCSSWICCEDLPLDDDVERGRRLVHDHSSGSSASAIAIITRCRMPPESSCGYARSAAPVDADELEQLARPGERLVLRMRSCAWIMSTNWSPTRVTGFSEFIALWKTIETFRQRNPRSSSGSQAEQVLAVEADAAAGDVRRAAAGLHDRVRDRALAAARLARQADDLAGPDRERDPVDGATRGVSPAVLDDEPVDLDQGSGRRRARRPYLGGRSAHVTLLGRKSRVKSPGRGGFVSRSRGSLSSSMP